MGFFGKIFTWWNGATVSTAFNSMLSGEKAGTDAQGNAYYRAKKRYPKGHPFAGRERRWVIYNGEAEASRVSPDWHGWLHFTWDQPPTKAPLKHKAWEKPHQENLTGTIAAYAPTGSLRAPVPVTRRDYEAWQPE